MTAAADVNRRGKVKMPGEIRLQGSFFFFVFF